MSNPTKRRIATMLHRLADRVDPAGEARLSGLSFTFEPGRGSTLHGELGVHPITHPHPGCPLLYYPAMYDRAHTEAGRH